MPMSSRPIPTFHPSTRPPRVAAWATPAAAFLAMALTWLITWPLVGQPQRITTESGLMLRELGALCEMTDAGLSVRMAMPSEARPEAYRSLDLREGDVIMAWNGKRLRELATARALYEEAEPGSMVALGVDRDGQKRILRFAKADPAELPDRMVFRGPGGGHVMVMQTVEVGGGDVVMIQGLGILAEDHEDEVRVAVVLPMGENVLREQDVMVEVVGTAIESAEHLAELVDAVAVGDDLAMVVRRDGEALTLSQPKTQARGEMRLRRGGR